MSLNQETKLLHKCDVCKKSWKTERGLLGHRCEPSTTKKRESRDVNYECEFCRTNYATERGIENHRCDVRARMEMLQTPLGQASFLFYAKWMRACKRSIPSITTFSTSRFYESFLRFAKFNKAVRLPSVDVYITVMVTKDIGPDLWTKDVAYGIYLEHMEFHLDPNTSVKITSDTLERLADEYSCNISDVFTSCTKNEIIQLIRERRLSPWILLKSLRFREWLGNLSESQLDTVQTLIDARFWNRRFKEHPKVVKLMIMCVNELGL